MTTNIIKNNEDVRFCTMFELGKLLEISGKWINLWKCEHC